MQPATQQVVCALLFLLAAERAILSFAHQAATTVAIVLASGPAIAHTANPRCQSVWIADIPVAAITIRLALASGISTRVARCLFPDVPATVARLVHAAVLCPLAAARDAQGCAIGTYVAAASPRATRAGREHRRCECGCGWVV